MEQRYHSIPHDTVVLLGNPSATRTTEEEGKGNEGGYLTRHLSIHLVLHVRGWRATADHTLRRHVVTVRRLRGRPTLIHPTRAHGHVLSGWLQTQTHTLAVVCTYTPDQSWRFSLVGSGGGGQTALKDPLTAVRAHTPKLNTLLMREIHVTVT